MSKRAFFIGGPGTLSASAIQDLVERDYEVAVFSRSKHLNQLPSRVCAYPGERHQTDALKNAFDDFNPDIVLDFICFTPQEAEQIKGLVQGKVRQFIFVSTVDVYGYPLSCLPISESDPWHPETQSQYAADKRLCEEIFKSPGPAALPLTIARPAYSFGPRFILSFTSRDYGIHMLRRLRDGRPILIPGDGTTLMHVSAALNTGRMIASLVDAPQSINRDYTCGHPNFTTHAGYVEMFASALGVQPNLVNIPTRTIVSHPDPEAGTCLLHALTRFNVAFSISRFLEEIPDFQWKVTLDEWAKAVVDWNLEHGLFDLPDDEIFDDRVIASWKNFMQDYRAF
ncbi:NAD-dependent epimerase/dehydratase family protein [Chloroflexota bacterium]